MGIRLKVPGQSRAAAPRRWPGRKCDLKPGSDDVLAAAGFEDVRLRANDSQGRNVLQLRTFEDLVARAYGTANPYTAEIAVRIEGPERAWIQSFDSAVSTSGPLIDPDPVSVPNLAANAGRLAGKLAGAPIPSPRNINSASRFLRGHPGLGVRRAHCPLAVEGTSVEIHVPSLDLWPDAGLEDDQDSDMERRVGELAERLSVFGQRVTEALTAAVAQGLSPREAAVVWLAFRNRSQRALVSLRSRKPFHVDVSLKEIAYEDGASQFIADIIDGRVR